MLASDVQPAIDAISGGSQTAIDGLLIEANRLEDEYQRKSKRGRRDVDISGRLRGATLRDGHDLATSLRLMDDASLAAKLSSDLDLAVDGDWVRTVPLTRAYHALAEMRRRNGGPAVRISPELEVALQIRDAPELTASPLGGAAQNAERHDVAFPAADSIRFGFGEGRVLAKRGFSGTWWVRVATGTDTVQQLISAGLAIEVPVPEPTDPRYQAAWERSGNGQTRPALTEAGLSTRPTTHLGEERTSWQDADP